MFLDIRLIKHPKLKLEIAKPLSKKTKTRSTSGYFLIGATETRISGSKLPTFGQVLRYLTHLKEMSSDRSLLRSNISCVVQKFLSFWSMAGIKTIHKRSAEIRLRKDHDEWLNLSKSKTRSSDPEGKREKFITALDKLWDIGALDAVEVINSNRLLTQEKKAEDIAFYEDRKGERKAVMSGMDKVFQKGLRKQQLRKQPRMTTEEQPTGSLSSDEFSSPGFSSSGGSGTKQITVKRLVQVPGRTSFL